MAAVWLRFRAELRRRWRAWLGLALLVGFAAGVVAAVATGARRTESVDERFHRELAGFDAYVTNFPDPGDALLAPEKIAALPNVTSAAQVRLEFLGPRGDTVVLTSPDERFGSVLQRSKVIDGRLPDPRRSGEVAIVTGSEERLSAKVGDRVPLVDPSVLPEELRPMLKDPEVTVVGIVAMPNEVALPRGSAPGGTMIGTPALHDEITNINDKLVKYAPDEVFPHPDGVAVRLSHGDRGVPEFRAGLERLAAETETGGAVSLERATERNVNLHRSMHLQAVTLWLLAGLLGLLGLVSILAAMRQSANVDAQDATSLQAIGFTSSGFIGLSLLRGIFIGVIGAAVAGVVGAVLSARVLFGLARDIEPDTGIVFDWTILGLALVVVLLVAIAATVIGGMLARRALHHAERAPVLRVPPATSVPAGVGVRFACGGWSLLGRGIAGPTVGIAALAGALVFGASLAHLRDDPELYGWRWETVATNYESLPPQSTDLVTPKGIAVLRDTSGIESAATGANFEAHVAGKDVFVLTFDAVKGTTADVLPPIASGRAPARPDEIALASRTMSRLGAHIGDRLELTVDGAKRPLTVTVVGRAVIPPVLGTVEPGEGALMTHRDTLAALGLEPAQYGASVTRVYLRVAHGTDGAAVIAALNQKLGGDPQLYELPRVEPSDLVDFGRVDGFPLLLGVVLALLAASTLVHVLVSSVRARRHDFATLRTFGVRRSQLGGIIAVQASFLVLVAVCVGVPLGLLLGRFAWTEYADRSGFISVVRVPALAILAVIGLAVVAAELCAALPARAAARTRPARLLRTE